MTGTEISSAGTKMYISPAPGAPATVLIRGFTDVGEAGPECKEIDVTDISDKWRRSSKGLLDAGKISLQGHYMPGDRGQQLLKQAVAFKAAYNFKIEYPDSLGMNGTFDYFAAQVLSFKNGPGKVDGIAEFKANLSGVGAVTTTAAA